MRIQTYTNKKGTERVSYSGKLEEFEKLDIDPDETYPKKGTAVIRDPDESTRLVLDAIIDEQDADEEEELDADEMTAREWGRKSGRFLLTWLETAPRVSVHTIVKQGGAEKDWAKIGMQLMFRDEWLDVSNGKFGKLNPFGREEVGLCLQMTDEAFPPSETDDEELADDTFDEILPIEE